jgi:Polysaccharide pyruvyl transferase
MTNASKYGLFSYRDTNNIGDEIQSLAARRFLPTVDSFIEREEMDQFCPEDLIPRKLIANGWYMHAPEHWPPSTYLDPLFISMHISREPGLYSGLCASKILLAPQTVDYLKTRGPIGARDEHTARILRAAGVEAYFSGCLTLTLDRRAAERDPDLVVVVDLPPDVISFIRARTKKNIIAIQHCDLNIKEQDERFQFAEMLLGIYSRAHCVVTSRLHCALPSLAMGTPVLLLDFAQDQYRFDGLRDLLHHADAQDFVTGLCRYDVNHPPANKGIHEELRDKLRERVSAFVGAPAKINPAQDLASQLRASEFIKWELSKALKGRLHGAKGFRGEAPALASVERREYVTSE